MTIDDLWDTIYSADSITIDVKTSYLPKLKRNLSSHKHRKVQEIGDDPGRLLSAKIGDGEGGMGLKKGYTRVRFWLDASLGNEIPATIVSVEDADANWKEAL